MSSTVESPPGVHDTLAVVMEEAGLTEPMMVEEGGGGIFQKYEEELEINDFPQQARWKVTSKEALAQISEYSEAGITVRGTYYGPGKAVPEGDRKLYLAIESTQELSVQKAKVGRVWSSLTYSHLTFCRWRSRGY